MFELSLLLKYIIGRSWFPALLNIDVNASEVIALLMSNRKYCGPFLLIGRDRGLALDTGGHAADDAPILWPPNAGPRQLWYFHRTEHREEYLIVSADNGLVLDARISTETPRDPVMWSRHGQSHQRWRLRPTEDAAAFFIESVNTGHVLDIPWEAGKDTPPILWKRHGEVNQQFLIVTPSDGPPR
jgi:Ricin-type beta-trefoil lectin domain-like